MSNLEKSDENKKEPSAAGMEGRRTFSHLGWYSRGYLPHFDSPDVIQHITYRLIDSLPHKVLQEFQTNLDASADEKMKKAELRRQTEAYLDAGHGSCVLAKPEIAACVLDTWLHFDGVRYHLLEWVVMPNHCHVLIKPIAGVPLGKIVLSWKNYTARFINEYLSRSGERLSQERLSQERLSQELPSQRLSPKGSIKSTPVWQRDYWDRYIRDESHLDTVRNYIVMNPVKAGLAEKPEDWPWSSARLRVMNDQEICIS